MVEAQQAFEANTQQPDHADRLVTALSPLGSLLAAPPHIPPGANAPADVRAALSRLGALLGQLRQHLLRLDARNQRALSVLFPAEQLQTYAKLGGRTVFGSGPGRSSGLAHLKA
ncbi:MAG: hypothetical protein RJA09_2577 [Pseudomonadota bacterium]|jgi:hypothetical protein